MANGYFEKGEIYYIRTDTGFGSEEGTFRPGVIISSNEGNVKTSVVNIAYLTTKPKNLSIYVKTYATGQWSWILCNQLATVDKSRISHRLGTLDDYEMGCVDKAIGLVLDIDNEKQVAKEKQQEVDELKAELAEKEQQLVAEKDKETAYKVEIAMWQRLYEKALDQVVGMKFGTDLARAAVEPPVEKIVAVEEGNNIVEPPVETRVDINHCTATALKKIGLSLPMAKLVASYRPFKDVADLKRVPGMSNQKYRILEPKVCCTPMENPPEKVTMFESEPDSGVDTGKVNVNTASWWEIKEKSGIGTTTAQSITGYRSKHGPYKSVEELRNVPYMGPKQFEKYSPMFEV